MLFCEAVTPSFCHLSILHPTSLFLEAVGDGDVRRCFRKAFIIAFKLFLKNITDHQTDHPRSTSGVDIFQFSDIFVYGI